MEGKFVVMFSSLLGGQSQGQVRTIRSSPYKRSTPNIQLAQVQRISSNNRNTSVTLSSTSRSHPFFQKLTDEVKTIHQRISLIYDQQEHADEMIKRLQRTIKEQEKGHLKLQTTHIRLRNIISSIYK